MSPAKNHQEMRLIVCVACLSPGYKRQVTASNLEKVRDHIYSGFNVDCLSLPSGICESCRLIVSSSSSQRLLLFMLGRFIFKTSWREMEMGLVLESSQSRLQKVSTMIGRSLSGTEDTKFQKPIQTNQTN